MHEHGVLSGHLRADWTLDSLARLVELEKGKPDPILRLAAMLRETADQAEHMGEDLRLSNVQKDRLVFLAEPPLTLSPGSTQVDLAVACYRYGKPHISDLLYLSAARGGGSEGLDRSLQTVSDWQEQHFPIAARDLLPMGATRGPVMGRLLRSLEDWWVAEGFKPDRSALLKRAKALIAQES